jgi:PAS domain S-box-containing protein
MRSILSPATNLMVRLTYPEKFALVGALFVVPLVVVLSLLLSEVHRGRAVAQRERAGNDYLRTVRHLTAGVQEHRALSTAAASRPRQEETQRRVDSIVDALDALDRELSPLLGTTGMWSAVKAEWAMLRDRNAALAPEKSFELHTVLVSHLHSLVRHVADSSRLILDPEVASHHLAALVADGLPSLAEHIEQARALAGGIAAGGRTSVHDRHQVTALNGVIGAELVGVRRHATAALTRDPSLRAPIDPLLRSVVADTRSYTRMLVGHMMISRATRRSPEQLWESGEKVVQSVAALADGSDRMLVQTLDARIGRLSRREVLVASLTLGALVAVVYLLAGFYRGVMRTVTTLDAAARRMAAGQVEEPPALPDSGRDELVIATRAFATLAARLRREWRAAQEKRAEAAAAAVKFEESNARVSAIMEAAADAIITIDEQGIIQSFNAAAKLMFGYTASEVSGQNVSMLMPAPHAERHDDYIARYLRTGVPLVLGIRREAEGVRRDGTRFPIRIAVSEMLWQGKRLFTGIVTDLSAQRETEARLEQAQTAAVAATRLASEYLSRVGDAFRRPLSALAGIADPACTDGPGGERFALASRMRGEAETLLGMLGDVLDFAKLEADPPELGDGPFRLRERLRETLDPFATRARERGLDLVYDVAPEVPEVLRGDADALQKITSKLVENAIQFTREGRIGVRFDVLPGGSGDDEAVRLLGVVEDTGIGIGADAQHDIFRPFTHAGAPPARQEEGTGLGLAIAHRLVERMGGRMWLESELGTGSRFHFTVHLRPGPDARGIAAGAAPEPRDT